MARNVRWLRALWWLLRGTPTQRRRVRLELARMSAALFGDFPLSEDHKVWREDQAFLDDYKRLSPGNPYSQDRKWVLREFARLTDSLPGDLAECGCFEGASAFFISQASSHGELFLFDSFKGLSRATELDKASGGDVRAWTSGDMRSHQTTLDRNLAGFERIQILPGWIPERFGEVASRTFRLVHIDVDLYEPTRDSLAFFYPRLVEGGVIVMDDYGFRTCPGAKRAADEFAAKQDVPILHLPTGQGIFMRCGPPQHR